MVLIQKLFLSLKPWINIFLTFEHQWLINTLGKSFEQRAQSLFSVFGTYPQLWTYTGSKTVNTRSCDSHLHQTQEIPQSYDHLWELGVQLAFAGTLHAWPLSSWMWQGTRCRECSCQCITMSNTYASNSCFILVYSSLVIVSSPTCDYQ